MPPGDRDLVRHASHVEARPGEVAGLDRMIEELVVVDGAIGAEAALGRPVARHGGRHPPRRIFVARGCRDVDDARRVLAAFGQQEHRRAVEIAAGGVEVGRAHRQVERVHLRDDRHASARGRRVPRALVDLPDRQRLAVARRAHLHEVAREVADQVAAGNPGGQQEAMALGGRLVDGDGDFVQVCVRVERGDAIAGRGHECLRGRVAPPAGVEPAAYRLGGGRSIH